MTIIEQSTLSHFTSLLSNQASKFYKTSRQQFDDAWKLALESLANEAEFFKTKLEESKHLESALTFAKITVEHCLIHLLKASLLDYRENDPEFNQTQLLGAQKELSSLKANLDMIRAKGGKAITEESEISSFYQASGVIYFLLNTLEEFHDFVIRISEEKTVSYLSQASQEPIDRYSSPDPLIFLDLMLQTERENSIVNLENVTHILTAKPLTFTEIRKEPQTEGGKVISPKHQSNRGKRSSLPKMIEFDKDANPCMENACGLVCTFTACKRGHATPDTVTAPLLRLGTKKCIRSGPKGSTCEKNKQLLKMKNGFVLSLCPDLHNDSLDESKIELGRRWNLFSQGKITYEQIFK